MKFSAFISHSFVYYVLLLSTILNASNLQVKIINNATVPVAFVIVRTEARSDYYRLYAGEGLSEDARQAALASMQKNMDIVVLAPRGDSETVTNASQDLMEYDRVLWLTPLLGNSFEKNLLQLAESVQNGFLGNYPMVRPYEIGSAKTVIITGNGSSLQVQTPGKLKEGAKALLRSSKTKPTPPSTAGAAGFPLNEVLAGDPMVIAAVKAKMSSSAGMRAGAKSTSKNKSKVVTGDPEGWPTKKNIQVYRSFDQAVADLQLPQQAIEDLRNYKDLVDKRQAILSFIKSKVQKNYTKSKLYAWQNIKKYADYHDDIPFGVR